MLDEPDGGRPVQRIGPIVPATDNNPWKDVAKQVAAGDIVFEPIAAQTAAEECVEAISRVLGLEKTIAGMDTLKELSYLPSGGLLATQFNNTLQGLNTVLGSHKSVLTEMLHTFKEAGKKYIDTELDSAWGFDKQTREAMKNSLDGVKVRPADGAKDFSTKAPQLGKDWKGPKTGHQDDDGEVTPGGVRDFTNTLDTKELRSVGLDEVKPQDLVRPASYPDRMFDNLGSNQTQPESLWQAQLETGPNPENPGMALWNELYKLGKSTEKAIKPVHHAGKMWDWMAGEMDDAVGQFAEKLTKMPETLWKGEGADAAIGAVKNYHTKADDLTSRMKSFGSNLNYASKWLANTHKGMPTEEHPPKPVSVDGHATDLLGGGGSTEVTESDAANDAQNARALAIYRQNMENNYVQGVQTSSQYIPALNELPATSAKKPGDSKPGKDDEKTGQGGGTGPGYTGGTGPGYTGGAGPGLTGGAGPGLTGGAGPAYTGAGNGTSGNDPYATSRPAPTPVDYKISGLDPSQVDSGTDPSLINPAGAGANGLGEAVGLGQQGLSGLQSAAQEAARAAAQDAAMRSMPNMPGLGDPARSGTPSGLGGARAGGVGGGAGGSSPAAPWCEPRRKPRACSPEPASRVRRLRRPPG